MRVIDANLETVPRPVPDSDNAKTPLRTMDLRYFPKARTFCFGGNPSQQVMGQKAMAKQITVQMENLAGSTAPHSLMVSAANLSCWPETHE